MGNGLGNGGDNRTFLGELSFQTLVGLVLLLLLAAAAAVIALGVVGFVLIALLAAGIGLSLRFRLLQRYRAWKAKREWEELAGWVTIEMLSYMTHLRDVNKAFSRARADKPEDVSRRVRDEVLEPIRGLLTTPPGGEVKVVWFRPEPDGTHLAMYEQVGHSPEGEAALRLRIGVGRSFAGEAFVADEPVWSNHCETEATFEQVEKGKATGSLACLPVTRGGEVTGVLSVLANWSGAFWLSDIAYFHALASAIGALEPLEEGGNAAAESK